MYLLSWGGHFTKIIFCKHISYLMFALYFKLALDFCELYIFLRNIKYALNINSTKRVYMLIRRRIYDIKYFHVFCWMTLHKIFIMKHNCCNDIRDVDSINIPLRPVIYANISSEPTNHHIDAKNGIKYNRKINWINLLSLSIQDNT